MAGTAVAMAPAATGGAADSHPPSTTGWAPDAQHMYKELIGVHPNRK